jgi:hypothetical protein
MEDIHDLPFAAGESGSIGLIRHVEIGHGCGVEKSTVLKIQQEAANVKRHIFRNLSWRQPRRDEPGPAATILD